MLELYLIRGLPGSGKTTLAKKLINIMGTHGFHFEADQYFIKNGVYQFDANKLGDAHDYCFSSVEEVFMWKCSKPYATTVVVANTFTRLDEMQKYFDLAKQYGVTPIVIECQNVFDSVHNVPKKTYKRMKRRFNHDVSTMFKTEENNESNSDNSEHLDGGDKGC